MVKAVIWDFNGTILDDYGLCLQVINQMLTRRHLPALSNERYLDLFDFPIREYYRKAGFDFTAEPFPALAEEYMALYQPASLACPLRRNIAETLADLQERGIRQILLSATEREFLRRQVGHYNLTGYFAQIIGLDDILGRSKLELAREWFGRQSFGPGETILIGDTTHDHAVAQALHCACLLVRGGHNSRSRLLETGVPVLDEPADLIRHLTSPAGAFSGIM